MFGIYRRKSVYLRTVLEYSLDNLYNCYPKAEENVSLSEHSGTAMCARRAHFWSREPFKVGFLRAEPLASSHFIEQLLRGDAVVFFEGFVFTEGAHTLNEFSEVNKACVTC